MGSLLNLIPGFSQAKLIAIAVAVLAVFGTIGYLKYENVQLENRALKTQNLLDNANNVIRQEKEANDSLVATIKKLKEDTANIIREQQEAIKNDQSTVSVKEQKAQKLNDKLNALDNIKTPANENSYNEEQEKFLREYNADLACRNANPDKLSACQ